LEKQAKFNLFIRKAESAIGIKGIWREKETPQTTARGRTAAAGIN